MTEPALYCSFCGISNKEMPLSILIDARTAQICDRCVMIARDVIWQYRHDEWLKLKDFAP